MARISSFFIVFHMYAYVFNVYPCYFFHFFVWCSLDFLGFAYHLFKNVNFIFVWCLTFLEVPCALICNSSCIVSFYLCYVWFSDIFYECMYIIQSFTWLLFDLRKYLDFSPKFYFNYHVILYFLPELIILCMFFIFFSWSFFSLQFSFCLCSCELF